MFSNLGALVSWEHIKFQALSQSNTNLFLIPTYRSEEIARGPLSEGLWGLLNLLHMSSNIFRGKHFQLKESRVKTNKKLSSKVFCILIMLCRKKKKKPSRISSVLFSLFFFTILLMKTAVGSARIWAKWCGDFNGGMTLIQLHGCDSPIIVKYLNTHFAWNIYIYNLRTFLNYWGTLKKNTTHTRPENNFHNAVESVDMLKIKLMDNFRAWGYLQRNASGTSLKWLAILRCISASTENFSWSLGLKTAGYKKPSYFSLM